MSYASVPQNSV